MFTIDFITTTCLLTSFFIGGISMGMTGFGSAILAQVNMYEIILLETPGEESFESTKLLRLIKAYKCDEYTHTMQ